MNEHAFCRRLFIEARNKLGIKHSEVDIVHFSKNDSHREVHVPTRFRPESHGNMGCSYTGCCNWSAGHMAMMELLEEKDE